MAKITPVYAGPAENDAPIKYLQTWDNVVGLAKVEGNNGVWMKIWDNSGVIGYIPPGTRWVETHNNNEHPHTVKQNRPEYTDPVPRKPVAWKIIIPSVVGAAIYIITMWSKLTSPGAVIIVLFFALMLAGAIASTLPSTSLPKLAYVMTAFSSCPRKRASRAQCSECVPGLPFPRE